MVVSGLMRVDEVETVMVFDDGNEPISSYLLFTFNVICVWQRRGGVPSTSGGVKTGRHGVTIPTYFDTILGLHRWRGTTLGIYPFS